jgi:hypothetical protein
MRWMLWFLYNQHVSELAACMHTQNYSSAYTTYMHAHIDYSSDILELHLAHDLLVSTLSNPLSSESLFPTKCSFAAKELPKLPLA